MSGPRQPGARRLALHAGGEWPEGVVTPGATLMVGGFGEPGTPFYLIDRLVAEGPGSLTVIKNDANEAGVGVGGLLRAGLLARMITSHIGLNREMVAAMDAGEVEVEFQPQGVLAEKIRCGGVGIPAFLTDIGVGILDGPAADHTGERETLEWRGERYFLEPALRADVALLHAHRADRYGNLSYRLSARNFSPLMAMAADRVVVEVEELVDSPLDPELVHTPGSFVDHLVVVPPGFMPPTRAAGLQRSGVSAD